MDERDRLIEIMKSQGLNFKQLSLKLGVSAGTISNIMGGRNKPSLELLQNVANHFPFISPTWLFLGFGEMYIDGYLPTEDGLLTRENFSLSAQVCSHNSVSTSKRCGVTKEEVVLPAPLSVRTVKKVLIFYTDGTFEER